HSVMESLIQGKLALVGPYHKNSPEALEFKQLEIGNGISAVQEFNTQSELRQVFAQIDQLDPKTIEDTILKSLESHKGASVRIANIILENNLISSKNQKVAEIL